MPPEKTQTLPSILSSSVSASYTFLSDLFSSCSSSFPRLSSRITTAVNEATRSEIFKNMLDSDSFKAAPSNTMTVPELNSEELESLLEFLYSGSLPLEKLEKHVYPLFIAAQKYQIPYLHEFCQCYMLNSLNASSVLDVLETSEVCSNKGLKEIALNFIFKNTEAVVLSDKYEALAAKNPQLCMQITKEFFMHARTDKVSRVRMSFQKKMGLQAQAKAAGEGKIGSSQELMEESHV
ncbi:hypothetical protein PTKIN_Ptkin16aG0018300 [Pterospermum kingtungense]